MIGTARIPGWNGLTNSGIAIGPCIGLVALVINAGKTAGMILRNTTDTVGRNTIQASILERSLFWVVCFVVSFDESLVFFGVSFVSLDVSLGESLDVSFDLFLPKFSFLF